MWIICYFTFLIFLLKIQGFMLLMNCVLIDLSILYGSFTQILFICTSSAFVFGNLNYPPKQFCSLDVRFLAHEVTEVPQ